MFMANEPAIGAARIEDKIHLIRGQRVMRDADLAAVYGTTTTRLNEQYRRNKARFPVDFAFRLTAAEHKNLMSQIAISSGHGGRRKAAVVFTEHGAIMLASVLRSKIAMEASVQVVRAFVRLRELLATHRVLAGKLAELEMKITSHDADIGKLFETIQQMLEPPGRTQEEIGFHVNQRRTATKKKKSKSRK